MIANRLNSVLFSLTLKSLLLVFLISPQTTAAYFSNTETASAQSFNAGRLVLDPIYGDAVLLTPQARSVVVDIDTKLQSGSIAAEHDLVVSSLSGDSGLCAGLGFNATNPSGVSATTTLTGFVSEATAQFGTWRLAFTYPTNLATIPHGAACVIQFTTKAWQSNMSKETAGFHHSQTFVIEVALSAVVLNEVMANPATARGEIEFIEIFNFSGLPVNVAGWNIAERTATGTVINHFISSSTTGPARDLVAFDGSLNTVIQPGGFLALRYRGGSSYLNINGDTVTLIETPTGRVLDEFTYTRAPRSDTFSRLPDGFGPWIIAISTPNASNAIHSAPVTTMMSFSLTEEVTTGDEKTATSTPETDDTNTDKGPAGSEPKETVKDGDDNDSPKNEEVKTGDETGASTPKTNDTYTDEGSPGGESNDLVNEGGGDSQPEEIGTTGGGDEVPPATGSFDSGNESSGGGDEAHPADPKPTDDSGTPADAPPSVGSDVDTNHI